MKNNIYKLVVFAVAIFIAGISITSCKEDKAPKIATYDDAVKVFNAAFGITEEWNKPFEVYPSNRLYVDLQNKALCYVSEKDKTNKWHYENTQMGAVKKVVSDYANDFKKWINDTFPHSGNNDVSYNDVLKEIDIVEKYKSQIDKSSVSDPDKIFSLIYNSLVGSPSKTVISAQVVGGNWQKTYIDDYTDGFILQKDRFVEAVQEAVQSGEWKYHKNAYDFLEKKELLIDSSTPSLCYWDFREDMCYIYPNQKHTIKEGSNECSQCKSKPCPLTDQLQEQIRSNPDKVYIYKDSTLVDLDSFYSEQKVCLDASKNVTTTLLQKKLYDAQVNQQKNEHSLWKIALLAVLAVAFVLLLVKMFMNMKKSKANGQGGLFVKDRENCKKRVGVKKSEKTPVVVPVVKENNSESVEHLGLLEKLNKIAEGNAPSAEEILKAFDEEYKKNVVSTLNKRDEDNSVKAKKYDSLAVNVKDSKAMKDVLSAVDSEFDTSTMELYENEIKNVKKKAEWYDGFVKISTEDALNKNLVNIRDKHKSFPLLRTVKQLVADAQTTSDVLDQIRTILKECDSAMLDTYESVLNASQAYARVGKVFRSENSSLDCEREMTRLLDGLVAEDARSILDKCFEFALQFQLPDPAADKEFETAVSAARSKYEQIDNALDSLISAVSEIMKKETMDYWDRLAFLVTLSVNSKELFKARGNDCSDKIGAALEAFKRDILYLYITRNFVIASKDSSVEYFVDEILNQRVVSKVNEFNSALPTEPLDMKDETIRACMSQCVDSIRKMRREEAMMAMFELIWNKYVRDFSENVSSNRDKGWLLGNSVQIAMYLADFLRHVVGGSDEFYCSNYSYLKTGNLADCDKEFVHNDYCNSDEFSNFVYEFLKEHNASGIDMIVNNFHIGM